MTDLIYKYTKGELNLSDLIKCIQDDQYHIVNYLKYTLSIQLKHYFLTSDTQNHSTRNLPI